jgi:hypothetical protein
VHYNIDEIRHSVDVVSEIVPGDTLHHQHIMYG